MIFTPPSVKATKLTPLPPTGTVQLDPTEAVIEPQELEEGEKETTESENDKEEQKISQWPEDRLGMPRFNGTLKDWENWVTVAAARGRSRQIERFCVES